MKKSANGKFAPLRQGLSLSAKEKYLLKPFFTNLNKSVFAVPFLPPEVIGALCSRASRAKGDLRVIFLNEFIKPFIKTKSKYGKALEALIGFLHKNPLELIFSNPKGREFYIKWLAQYGDDSIAQMSATHLCYQTLSQVAIKHFEDMRIGIAPIEKSTRYVDYSSKINGNYLYYADPTLSQKAGLISEYKQTMDFLFSTYSRLSKKYLKDLIEKYPKEKQYVLKAKAFDTFRKLLPMATLSQVAFFANGQAFEYFIHRSLDNNLGEIRWAGASALTELNKIIPAFLRRLESPAAKDYRKYKSQRSKRIISALKKISWKTSPIKAKSEAVKLIEYDKNGEDKIIAGLIFPQTHIPFERILETVKKMPKKDKEAILQSALKNRKARWYKAPRAFENAYLRFGITVNLGAWRDLHRHRMQTQFRENFSIFHGFDIPPEVRKTKFEADYIKAIKKAENLFKKVYKFNPEIAQYCPTLAHKVRFIQFQNMRSFFWEAELRTIAQGHPDYRKIEHEKVRLVKKVYPLVCKYLLADMNEYAFARRGTLKKIEKKEKKLLSI